jgi:8-amino-7-oxononanoate synthase
MLNFFNDIENIKLKGLYRKISYLEAASDPHTIIDGKEVILMSSNNYLGLCNDIRLKQAAIEAINRFGVGSGGSRLTTGSFLLHKQLEDSIASFKSCKKSIVFSSGFSANIGTISAITDKDWVIFCDRLNHASIINGCRLSGAKVVIYKHIDVNDLKIKVEKYKGAKNLIITDGVFSMDGDIAPLPDIVDIAKKHNITVMVDDAHAAGIIGKSGAGTSEYFNLENEIDIKMGTLSKAFAGVGAYIAGSDSLIEYLKHNAKSFVYSTSLAPHNIAVSLKALEIVKNEPLIREDLISKSIFLRTELRDIGFDIPDNITPIIPVKIGDPSIAVDFSSQLLKNGIYIPAIRPPTVPNNTSRLRISVMATHTYEDLKKVSDCIASVGRVMNLI